MVTQIQFEEAISQLVPLQRELKVLAAWVKMGRSLIISPPNKSKFTEGLSIPFSKGHSMGLWINGAEEKVAVWFIEMGIPVFVVHKTQSKVDAQFFNKETTYSRFPFDNCDLEFTLIPLRFHDMLEASKGQLRSNLSWKVAKVWFDSRTFGFLLELEAPFFNGRDLKTEMGKLTWVYFDQEPKRSDEGSLPTVIPERTTKGGDNDHPNPSPTISPQETQSQVTAETEDLMVVDTPSPLLLTTNLMTPTTAEPDDLEPMEKVLKDQQVRDGTSPYLWIAGIGTQSFTDFKAWISQAVPGLTPTVIFKVTNGGDSPLFFIKFFDRHQAKRFKEAYHMKRNVDHLLLISFAFHDDYIRLKESDGMVLEQWENKIQIRKTAQTPHHLTQEHKDLGMEERKNKKQKADRGGCRKIIAQSYLGPPA
ncbi:hypothetical protein BDP27DRAFT_1367308 [Rhodocollybia butyracea]|uniref:Uncharacterized protein n=1 Tax=Rhodocollybia butyracea TaxID=206335 RepID=A0A9P5PKN9_9AGAR|nr:hypothetical protein BDP27DRAFT_1367308 [Rhodocollybia butyracea]